MPKCVTDISNMAGPAHPPGSIATNTNIPSGGSVTVPPVLQQGHSAKSLDRDGK